MFSIADMAVAGAVALLLFGPDQLPKVARRAGQLVRDVQNTSQSFIREMERAADVHDEPERKPVDPVPASALTAAPLYHETPEPAAQELVAREGVLEHHTSVSEPAIGVSEPAIGIRRPAGAPEGDHSSPGKPAP